MTATMRESTIVLRSERIVTPSGVLAGTLRIRAGRIEAISAARAREPSAVAAVDFGSDWVVPGFIDTHVHGGGGAQLHTTDPAELAAACRFHALHGTTALLATTVSAPVAELSAILATIARASTAAAPAGARVLGAHLEGPFLSPALSGAMDPTTFLAPAGELMSRLREAAGGTLSMMTLAPELPGALALIRDLHAHGEVASLGHTDADYETVVAAVNAGARSATHLFNAMRGLHHRAPGAVGAVLDSDQLNAELICDGEHVSPAVLRLAHRAKGTGGLRLITDAMAGAGMPDGTYPLGRATIAVAGGRATRMHGDTLAGSTLTMDEAMRQAVAALGLSLPEAVALTAANPARVLGLQARKGQIAIGMDADFAVLDDALNVRCTVVGGAWVQGEPS
jgi:N-acetylglucosamine-6-phosphate deacetylase